MPFPFVDLFAGIGGFHAALSAAGGECVFASEIDRAASTVYQRNWNPSNLDGVSSFPMGGDIVPLTERRMDVPPHSVLTAGFPCQPFSKSGFQLGMAEARGTLFWNILRVLQRRKPAVVMLENVRNIAGPRHRHEWEVIIRSLRELGYRVSDQPTVFSPHLLPKRLGGTPQVRERVFIMGTYVGRRKAIRQTDIEPVVQKIPVGKWDPRDWDLDRDLLQPDDEIAEIEKYRLSSNEIEWIQTWDDLVNRVRERRKGQRLPGFPIWADSFAAIDERELVGLPAWKIGFLRKNSSFYLEYKDLIDDWLAASQNLEHFPASRRKLEWQAQDSTSLWETVMHLRPSGIRAKPPTYLPALVAMAQTSVIGWRKRRITPREAARLQGLPDWFDFGNQSDAVTYKQLGNGVAVGAVYHVFREHVRRDGEDLPLEIVDPVLSAGKMPKPPRPKKFVKP